jgi:Cys-rich repeat protein
MRRAWWVLVLALPGCLALWDHTGPWPCASDADCQSGQVCAATKCVTPVSASGDGGGQNGAYCCLNTITGACGCVTPQFACQSTDQGPYASCDCGDSFLGDAGLSESCSLPTLQWGRCCLSTLEGTCSCYTSGGACNSTLESPVQSCTAAATQASGVGCQVSSGSCTCDSLYSGGTSACPSSLVPICCQSTSACNCSYNTECLGSEQKVPSCNASALQPLKQCSVEEMLVASCP